MTMIPGFVPVEYLEKEVFCKEIGIERNCWIFQNIGKEHIFYKYEDPEEKTTIYTFDNGLGMIRDFKMMPEYGEIWNRIRHVDFSDQKSLWHTWKIID